MLISAEHLSINFGSRQLLDDVDFYLNEGDKTGVIGINGTGKSTFLKVLAGWLQPDSGTIARKPNLQVSVLAQNPDMHDDLTVLEQIFASMPPEFRQLNEYEAKRMLTRLGLADTNRLIGTLSGGERRRAALCAALIASYEFAGFAYGRPKAIKSIFWSQFAAFLCITALPDDRAGGQQLMLAAIAGILLFQSYLTASNIRPAVWGPVGGAQ